MYNILTSSTWISEAIVCLRDFSVSAPLCVSLCVFMVRVSAQCCVCTYVCTCPSVQNNVGQNPWKCRAFYSIRTVDIKAFIILVHLAGGNNSIVVEVQSFQHDANVLVRVTDKGRTTEGKTNFYDSHNVNIVNSCLSLPFDWLNM